MIELLLATTLLIHVDESVWSCPYHIRMGNCERRTVVWVQTHEDRAYRVACNNDRKGSFSYDMVWIEGSRIHGRYRFTDYSAPCWTI